MMILIVLIYMMMDALLDEYFDIFHLIYMKEKYDADDNDEYDEYSNDEDVDTDKW